VGAGVAFLLALGVYGYTLAPGVIWGDSASLAVQVHEQEFFFGTAGDHPLFVFLGLAFARLPGELARNLNLLSAVCAALAVAVVFLVGQALGSSVLSGAVAAAALAFSHAFWLHAVITEVYTLSLRRGQSLGPVSAAAGQRLRPLRGRGAGRGGAAPFPGVDWHPSRSGVGGVPFRRPWLATRVAP
jgi:hypothetical protein